MSTAAASGRGTAHLAAVSPDEVALDPAEQLAIHQTLARYSFALDHQDLEGLRSVLTEDARWTFEIAGGSDLGPITGRAAILEFVRAAMDTTDQRRHHLTNVAVTSVGGGTARVRAYLMLTSNAGGSSSVIATGLYTFILQHDDGGWRIVDLLLGMDNAA